MTVPAGSPQYSGSERRDAHPTPQVAGQPAGGLVAGAPLGSSYRLVRRVGSGAVGEVWAATMSGSWASVCGEGFASGACGEPCGS